MKCTSTKASTHYSIEIFKSRKPKFRVDPIHHYKLQTFCFKILQGNQYGLSISGNPMVMASASNSSPAKSLCWLQFSFWCMSVLVKSSLLFHARWHIFDWWIQFWIWITYTYMSIVNQSKINNIIKKQLLNNNNKRKNCYQSISHHRVCILECTFLVVVD